jgi:hypothetical protein
MLICDVLQQIAYCNANCIEKVLQAENSSILKLKYELKEGHQWTETTRS